MTIVAFLIYVVVFVLLAFLALWIIDTLAPSHPPIINTIVWVVVVVAIVFMLLEATGLLGLSPMIPRVRS